MSGFTNQRRGNNMYPNIAHLNTVPSDYDLAMQQQNNLDLEPDLSLFTDGEFFDFDMGDMDDGVAAFNQKNISQPSSALPSNAQPACLNGDFQFQDFYSGVPNTTGVSARPAVSTFNQVVSPQSTVPGSPVVNSPVSAEKRKSISLEESGDGVARVAAEEDKRRRNTAASARFRVKKKQREQAMEKTAKDMADRVSRLESRIGSLESENKILRDLLTDKVGKDVDIDELQKQVSKQTADEESQKVKAETAAGR